MGAPHRPVKRFPVSIFAALLSGGTARAPSGERAGAWGRTARGTVRMDAAGYQAGTSPSFSRRIQRRSISTATTVSPTARPIHTPVPRSGV